jgi:hypothetical protein
MWRDVIGFLVVLVGLVVVAKVVIVFRSRRTQRPQPRRGGRTTPGPDVPDQEG